MPTKPHPKTTKKNVMMLTRLHAPWPPQAKGGGLDFEDAETEEFTWDEAMAGAKALRVSWYTRLRLNVRVCWL